jgi:positive regulator of sigma E activity
MAERAAEVICVDPQRITLRLLGTCSDCSGCGGRCSLFGDLVDGDRLQLGLESFQTPPNVGECWTLVLPERDLLRQAWSGYGRALLGFVLGAVFGHALARQLGWSTDVVTAIAAFAGTLPALMLSKRARATVPQLVRDVRPR